MHIRIQVACEPDEKIPEISVMRQTGTDYEGYPILSRVAVNSEKAPHLIVEANPGDTLTIEVAKFPLL